MEYYTYKEGLDHANRIVDRVSVIIDAVDRANNTAMAQGPSGSTADELAKLAALKEKGILTEEEFAEQKKKLLGGLETSNPDSQKKRIEISLPKADPIEEEIRNLVMNGQKLEAIKKYKEYTGCELRAALDYVESIC